MTRPIDFSKYPIRTCRSLHCCDICGEEITLGEQYRDGGYGRRAHVACHSADEPEVVIVGGFPDHPELSVRGWMGGGTIGGQDPDDADRFPECEECLGQERPCLKCIAPTPWPELFAKPVPMLPMTEAARLKVKEAIRKLRERMNSEWLDEVVDAHGQGQESALEEVAKPALSIISELCGAIETCSLDKTNEFVENARRRARSFLESQPLSWRDGK